MNADYQPGGGRTRWGLGLDVALGRPMGTCYAEGSTWLLDAAERAYGATTFDVLSKALGELSRLELSMGSNVLTLSRLTFF